MTYSEISRRLCAHLAAMPQAPPLIFDNAPARLPRQGLFLEAVLLPDAAAASDFCGRIRQSGLFDVRVFAPALDGAGACLQAADAVAAHFDRQRLQGLQCLPPILSRVGSVGEFFVYNVSVPWHVLEGSR